MNTIEEMIGITLKYKAVKDGWIVYNEELEYKNHAHLRSGHTCRRLIKLLNKNIMPESQYLRGSAKRLLTENEFNKLKIKEKKKYINVMKGVRRC